ncbi:MAG: glycosyl transferase [Rhodospirillales bacterium CG15_BIG_FIL_POST_REV_8_21_14_020_66_15]|nr:MAG: glycosyl transferase [Rhodospirillales bacterium CG15_BIG_FIL_POST_REV_8_21_14_020_66_15]
MKVLQAMAGAEFGGAEAFFVRLVCALARAGLEQRVLIRENKARAQMLREAGIEPLELPFGGMFDRRTPRAMKHEIKTFQPQIVMTWMNRATRFCPDGDFAQVGRLGGYYDLKYYRTCDHLIGNTQDIVNHIVGQGWDKSRVHYLPNFVSEERAEPVSRRSLYTPDNAALILALGRLHENKGFDVLLRAMARVPNTYLWLAGEGPLRESLEKQAEDLGIKPRVRFLGWREDTPALFAACDLFVCPSRHEPLGNVVLEAWAQGVPVIAADSMGPGTLIDHMDSGVLVPVDDADALARAVRGVIGDYELAEHIARRGREVYEERFTEAQVVQRYLDFFQSVANKQAN